jgi:hypothetical protein
MTVQYLHDNLLAWSTFTAETAYDTAGTVNSTNFSTVVEIESIRVNYDDTRRDGQGEGNEFGSEGYVTRKSVTITMNFPFLRPNDLAGLSAYALGATAATQDGAVVAYRHKATLGSTLQSFSMVISEAGIQKLFTGCKINTLTIARSGEYWSATAEVIGSGRWVSNADSYPAEISEEPLLYGNTSMWLERGADVNIAAAPTQGSQNISASTPDDIKCDVTGDMSVTINNNLRTDRGYDCSNTNDSLARGQLERGAQREITAEFPMTFEDDQELTDFLGTDNVQEHIALEINQVETAQGVIAATGAMYFGFVLIVPRMNYEPIGEAADDDGVITRNLRLKAKTPTAADENSTEVIEIYTYNAQAAYMG